MSRLVLDRYERDSQGNILIDVAAEQTSDLFEEFDRRAPYIKRDLDRDLVDYLIECATELGKEPFRFYFSLQQPPDDERRDRIRKGIHSYFTSLGVIEQRKVRQMWRRSAVLFSLGLSLLFLSVLEHKRLGDDPSVVQKVIAEGLTVAAWMSMWESLATVALDFFPLRQSRRLFRKLAQTKVLFRGS